MMTLRQLERALRDKSISDKKFFKILLQYYKEQDAKMQEFKKDVSSIHSPDFKKQRAALASLRALILVSRPAVHNMVLEHVLGAHEHCCGTKSKK